MIKCIAWDLVGKYSDLIDTTHEVFVRGGYTAYHFATNTRNDNIVLQRVDTSDGLRLIKRYIPFDTPVRLELISED